MDNVITPIYAPSIYLFRFQQHSGSTDFPEEFAKVNPEWVERQYQKIFAEFEFAEFLTIRRDRPSAHFDLIQTAGVEGRHYHFFEGVLSHGFTVSGLAYPQHIEDSYALNFTLFYPEKIGYDEVDIKDLKYFNPNLCFLPPSPEHYSPPNLLGYWGQTLLITTFLAQPKPRNITELEALHELSRQCIISFFDIPDPERCPKVYEEKELMGGYLYEYGSPTETLQENPYGRVLIWFFFEEKTSRILHNFYWEFPELFLYQHKIVKTFQDSQKTCQEADFGIAQIEQILQSFSLTAEATANAIATPRRDINALKTALKMLSTIAVDYSRSLRQLEAAHQEIATYARHHEKIVHRLQVLTRSSLRYFAAFTEVETQTFQKQIQANLRYFQQGSTLLNHTLAVLRSWIEIDRVECDRYHQTALVIFGLAIAIALLWGIHNG
jgi:hypothetical protein